MFLLLWLLDAWHSALSRLSQKKKRDPLQRHVGAIENITYAYLRLPHRVSMCHLLGPPRQASTAARL